MLTVEDSERVLEALKKAGTGQVTHSRSEVWGTEVVKIDGLAITFVAALFRVKSWYLQYAKVRSLFLGGVSNRRR